MQSFAVTQRVDRVSTLLRRPHPLPFFVLFSGGRPRVLGLDPAWSLNLFSIATLVAILVIVMTLGEVLFNSRAVGRLGSLLFFFLGRSLTSRFFEAELQLERLSKRSPVDGTIFRRSFRIAVKRAVVVSGDLSRSATLR